MSLEGGFQGRTNKLVDSCYSWWVGGIFPLLQPLLNPVKASSTKESISNDKKTDGSLDFKSRMGIALFNPQKLQEYILMCCQMESGGLCDKPGKSQDFYHTCYSLSGLSMAQHQVESDGKGGMEDTEVVGGKRNELRRTDPIYNAAPKTLAKAMKYFKSLQKPYDSKSSSSNFVSSKPT
mmetsp:Transcript_13824/g.20859  ORF Transcript_13824/g.20859 Transcript_13824/m.20859 type:complete len:179 (-) Transcript_13824:60-596(-)